MGEGGPAGPDEGQACHCRPFTGSPVGRHALMPPLLPLRLRSIAEACGGVRAPRPTHSDTRTAVISPRHLHFPRCPCIITAAQLSPSGEGGPAGPDEGPVCHCRPLTGNYRRPCPHQSAGGAADSFPRGGSRSFPKVSLSHEREAFLFTTYGRNRNFMVYYIG